MLLVSQSLPRGKNTNKPDLVGRGGGDDYVDNEDEDEVDNRLLDDGHDSVDDSIGKLDISIEGGDLLSVDLFRSGADEV